MRFGSLTSSLVRALSCWADSAAGCGRPASTVTRFSGSRQILGHRQPVHAARDPRSRTPSSGMPGTIVSPTTCAITPCVRPCDWICPSGYGVSGPAQIEVVDGHRLLEHVSFFAKRMEPLHHRRQVRHVAPADEARRVREAVRVRVVRRPQQQRGRVHGAARHDDTAARSTRSTWPSGRSRPPRRVRRPALGDQPLRERVGPQRDVRVRQRRRDAADLRVALRAGCLHGNELQVLHSTQPPGSPGSISPSGSGDGMQALTRAAARRSPPCRGACGIGAMRKRSARRLGRVVADARRARDTAARRGRSTARASRSRSARPATRRRRARPPGSPRAAAGRARCPRTSCCRRRRSACTAGTPRRARRASARSCGSAGASRPPPGSSSPSSVGTKSPRSRTRMRAPVPASACAIVPPPAPVPMMTMS